MEDIKQPGMYTHHPSMPAAVIAFVILLLITLGHLVQTIRFKSWVLFWLLFGAAAECAGFFLRLWSFTHETDVGTFIAAYLVPIVAPIYFASACHMVFGRIVMAVTPAADLRYQVLLLTPRWIAPAFLLTDLVSFFVQMFGIRAIAASLDWDTGAVEDASLMKLGDGVVKAGFVIQTCCLIVFSIFVFNFAIRSRNWSSPTGNKWNPLLAALLGAAGLLLHRCVYRIVEFSHPGGNTYINAHEWCFYLFDAVPVCGALLMLAIIHPGACLPREFVGFRQAVQPQSLEGHGQPVELARTAYGGYGSHSSQESQVLWPKGTQV